MYLSVVLETLNLIRFVRICEKLLRTYYNCTYNEIQIIVAEFNKRINEVLET